MMSSATKSMTSSEILPWFMGEGSNRDESALNAVNMVSNYILNTNVWKEFHSKCEQLELCGRVLKNAFFGHCGMNVQLLINRVLKIDKSLKDPISSESTSRQTTSTTSTTSTTTTTTTTTASVSSQVEVKLRSSTEIDRKDLIAQLENVKKHFKMTETHFVYNSLRIPHTAFHQAFKGFEESLKLASLATLETGLSNISFDEINCFYLKSIYLFVKEGKVHLFFQEKEISTWRDSRDLVFGGIHFTDNQVNSDQVLRLLRRAAKDDLIIFPYQKEFNQSVAMVDRIFKHIPKTPFFIKPNVMFNHKSDCCAVIENDCGEVAQYSADLRKNIDMIRQLGLALLDLHACGIDHGDITQNHVLYSKEGQLRIIDLSCAVTEESLKINNGRRPDVSQEVFKDLGYKSITLFQVAMTVISILNKNDFFERNDNGYVSYKQSGVDMIVADTMKEYLYLNLVNKGFVESLGIALDITKNSKLNPKSFYESLRDAAPAPRAMP